jgi:membrane-associated protein
MVLTEVLLSMNGNFFSFWGYVLVFGVLLIESIPFVGAFIPGGTVLLLLAGVLVKLGYFNLWTVLIGSMSVLFLVNIGGYFFGVHHPRRPLYRNACWVLINREMLEQVGSVVHGHTRKALLFGRLNPITRSIAPFLMGLQRVNFWTFLLYDLLGAALWVGGFVTLGYFIGNTLDLAKAAEIYIIWITVILAGAFYLYCWMEVVKKRGRRCKWSENGLDCKK